MDSVSKTVRLPRRLLRAIEHKVESEGVNESSAIRHLLALPAFGATGDDAACGLDPRKRIGGQ